MTNFIIDFIDTATDQEITQYLTDNACTVVRVFSNLNKVYLVSASTTPPKTSLTTSVINDTESALTLLTVVPVVLRTFDQVAVNVQDAEQWWKVYSVLGIDTNQVTAQINLHRNDEITYIVDSGITASHPEFIGKRIELFHSFNGSFTDSTGHGTALASVITGNTCSINDTVVKVVKIFEQGSATLLSDLLLAFDIIAADIALSPDRLSVINLSWTIARNAYVEGKIQLLIDQGAVVVVAAGNSGVPIEDVTPAAMKDVVTVGAYNHNFVPCNFSNYGGTSATSLTPGLTNYGELDGWAPGEQIWVAKPDGTYGFVAGTSVAAAIHTASLSYNVAGFLTDQDITQVVLTSNLTAKVPHPAGKYAFAQFKRSGLLDLNDVKYSNSQNLITTFINARSVNGVVQQVSDLTAIAKVGTTFTIELFNPAVTKSYEILTSPDFCTVVDARLLVAPKQETSSADGVEVTNFQVKITNSDDTTFIRSFSLIVTNPTVDVTNWSVSNPEITIYLANQTCSGYPNPYLFCSGYCSSVSSCMGIGKTGCWCQP